MEHIERAGIHSGDSIAVYPAWNITDEIIEKIVDQSRKDGVGDGITLGLVNIQYLIYENDLYVIEVNPRSSQNGSLYQQGDRCSYGRSWRRERCWVKS